MIFIPLMWYKSQFNNSTLDIQLHATYYVIAFNSIIRFLLVYLTFCAVIYWKHQHVGLNRFLTLFHLIVSLLFCTFFTDWLSGSFFRLRRYYIGVSEAPS